MANIMDLKGVRNNVHRNGFDLSQRNAFTAKVGELLPVFMREVLPGDKFDINLDTFTRTMPVNTAAFTRIQEYYDFYYVPFRLLWDKWPAYISQTNQPFHAASYMAGANLKNHPYMSGYQMYEILKNLALTEFGNTLASGRNKQCAYNALGYSRYETCCKLLTYLGYGPIKRNLECRFSGTYNSAPYNYTWADVPANYITNPYDDITSAGNIKDQALNMWPLLAYNKIYQDHFRFDQWENRAPYTCNLDYMMHEASEFEFPLENIDNNLSSGQMSPVNNTQFLFDLRYANYKKDLLMGLLPSPQFGDTAVASPISGITPATVSFIDPPSAGENDASITFVKSSTNPTTANTAGISVLALRQAEFLQKWREITQSGKQDYKSQIDLHWNVSLSPALSDVSEYLGGISGIININEVVNTALDGDASANLKGKATGAVNGHINRTFDEHGIIMCIYHAAPLLDYENVGLDRLCTKVTVGSYAIPEFDSLGMEAVRITDILAQNIVYEGSGSGSTTDAISILGEQSALNPLGYAPRYIEYKTARDVVNGGFMDTLVPWVSPIDAKSLFERLVDSDGQTDLKYTTFKITPSVVNPIFLPQVDEHSYIDEDSLLVSASFDCKVVRNLSRDGLPY